ncbi:hypothetical protein [Cellulomonas wangsupingiae]|uniref:hypothetical protein n=1 Tax=Cellulomonas wangsupingiae TaxID=2968085 RepID=UPI001D0DF581|nr:hypothetical protein [Cellulomonas wangsupingiae]MCM0639602.1 hypothetical protein [Cellulomonas wangsupingiae]
MSRVVGDGWGRPRRAASGAREVALPSVDERARTTARRPPPVDGVRRLRIAPAHVVDVFVYVVVLDLAQQYAPQVITESFSMSLPAAIVPKLVLGAVLAVRAST